MRSTNGTLNLTLRRMLLSLVIVGGISSGSALARTIYVEIAPPPARVEVVPEMRHGYTWAPGYWSWNRDRHVWVNGAHDADAHRICMDPGHLARDRRTSRVPRRSLDAQFGTRAVTEDGTPIGRSSP